MTLRATLRSEVRALVAETKKNVDVDEPDASSPGSLDPSAPGIQGGLFEVRAD
ncbi:MAG: hypothetical protein AAGE52_32355 [Myxococcota bacterium]